MDGDCMNSVDSLELLKPVGIAVQVCVFRAVAYGSSSRAHQILSRQASWANVGSYVIAGLSARSQFQAQLQRV